MFAAYDKRLLEEAQARGRDQEALQAAQSELLALQSSVREVVAENDSLRRELQEATHKLLQESTKPGGSPGGAGAGAELAGEARQELETMTQLLRSENNVLLSQRRSLAEEAQALKVHRDRMEGQLKQAQDELSATRGSLAEATARLQETSSDGTACQHELRSAQQRLSTAEHELAEANSDLVRYREELKSVRDTAEESTRSLEELRAQQRLEKSASMQHSDQLERLTQDYQDLQEKFRIRGRELESANQVAQDLAKTMESFEQRALETHQKDVEAFNLREETKEIIQNANLEKEAGVAREAALQREIEKLTERVRFTTHEASDAFEAEKATLHEKYTTVVEALEDKLTALTTQCAELQLQAERATREQRSTAATLQRLSQSNTVAAVDERLSEVAAMVSAAEQERDGALARLDEVGGAFERAQVALSKKDAEAGRRESALQAALARQERSASAAQDEAAKLSAALHETGVAYRQLQRQLEQVSRGAEEESSGMKRQHGALLEEMESSHRLQLEQERRAAHDAATHTAATAWQKKFEIATRRFDEIVGKLQQQNNQLRAKVGSGGGGDGDGSGGGTPSMKRVRLASLRFQL